MNRFVIERTLPDAIIGAEVAHSLSVRDGIVSALDDTTGTCTVTINGVDIPRVQYLDSFNPEVGYRVWLVMRDGDLFIIGCLTPPYDRPIGAAVWQAGPSVDINVVSTTTEILALTTNIVASHSYKLEARSIYIPVTTVPQTCNLLFIDDPTHPQFDVTGPTYVMSMLASSMALNDGFSATSFTHFVAKYTGSVRFSIKSTTAGGTIRFPANKTEMLLTRDG